jgi:hypothetical protein
MATAGPGVTTSLAPLQEFAPTDVSSNSSANSFHEMD